MIIKKTNTKMSNWVKGLLISFALLNVVDVVQTYIGVILKGFEEINPLVRFFLTDNPEPILTLILLKSMMFFLIFILIDGKKEKHQLTVLAILNGILLCAVLLNFSRLAQ